MLTFAQQKHTRFRIFSSGRKHRWRSQIPILIKIDRATFLQMALILQGFYKIMQNRRQKMLDKKVRFYRQINL